ncbi:MAG: 4-hydroxythreonine-4-phosphate dehydrogenase PdxA [Thermodesulfobacteriota bacterium]
METTHPIVGITMGDPVGIGPEIIVKILQRPELFRLCRPVVFGDAPLLRKVASGLNSRVIFREVRELSMAPADPDSVDIISGSQLNPEQIQWGRPTPETGRAMTTYITTAIDWAMDGKIDAVVTAPINKAAMKLAGSAFFGHTELFASRTRSDRFAMMMAGDTLRVVLVTIHVPLHAVSGMLQAEKILETIEITQRSLTHRFGLEKPRIAVAALNPHAGEGGLFGEEEANVIAPACEMAAAKGIDVHGPLPADTLFHQALQGAYDAVVCMYHDQGLIPFKMIHFTDGVNTTLGLPIIRTSVDHGTAYDIAGTWRADPGSLMAAVRMAAVQAMNSAR